MDDFIKRDSLAYESTSSSYRGLPNLPYQEYRKHVARNLPEGCLTQCHSTGPYFNPILMKLADNPPENSCVAAHKLKDSDYYRQCDPDAPQKPFDEIGETINSLVLRFPNDVFIYYLQVVNSAMGFSISNNIVNSAMPYWIFLIFSENRDTSFPVKTIGRLLKTSYLVEIRSMILEHQEDPDRRLLSMVMERLSGNRMYECLVKYWGPLIRLELSMSDQRTILDRLEWNSEEIFQRELPRIFSVLHLAEVIVAFIENEETVETINQRWNDFGPAFLEAVRSKVTKRLEATLGDDPLSRG